MTLEVERFDIAGVILVRPKKHSDARGYFVETYNARAYAEVGIGCDFVQDNESLSARRGTIRGAHFQIPPESQNKLVRVLRGSIFDVAIDLRRGSSTYGRWCSAILTREYGEQLFIPSGCAHAFCTLEADTEVAYKVDRFYAPACDSGLRWDDPDLDIAWPIDPSEVMVSDKDAKLPALKAFASPFAM
jgi:dTDP-4-dehydrorhamnose 3,5-epimerase